MHSDSSFVEQAPDVLGGEDALLQEERLNVIYTHNPLPHFVGEVRDVVNNCVSASLYSLTKASGEIAPHPSMYQ